MTPNSRIGSAATSGVTATQWLKAPRSFPPRVETPCLRASHRHDLYHPHLRTSALWEASTSNRSLKRDAYRCAHHCRRRFPVIPKSALAPQRPPTLPTRSNNVLVLARLRPDPLVCERQVCRTCGWILKRMESLISSPQVRLHTSKSMGPTKWRRRRLKYKAIL